MSAAVPESLLGCLPPWVRDAVYINIENFGFPNAHRAKPLPILAMFLLLC